MIRWMCTDTGKATRCRSNAGCDENKWHGHLERKYDADCVKACTSLVVGGRPNTWQNTVSTNMHLLIVDAWDVHGRNKWRAI